MKIIRTVSLFLSCVFFFAFSIMAKAENSFVKKDSIDISKIQNEIIKYYGLSKDDSDVHIIGSDVTLLTEKIYDDDGVEMEGMRMSISFSTEGLIIGKLNNDDLNDVVVLVGTEGPGNSWSSEVFIFISTSDSLKLFKVYTASELETISKVQSNSFPAQFMPEKIEGNQLIGKSTCWAESDGHCCPSVFLKTYFKFDNGLVFSKSEKISK